MKWFDEKDSEDLVNQIDPHRSLKKSLDNSIAKAEYNKEGRAKVEAHAAETHKKIQDLLHAHGKVISQHGDEFHSPGHLRKFTEKLHSGSIPYTHKVSRLAANKVDMQTAPKTFEHKLSGK